ncbi:MAG: heat-inducible transcriptional repressor HrcA [Eubacteriales bacterium]|jgi:heat-inducible transcriptional repressor
MELSDRKKKILSTIIESYIENAEPVGSRTISKHKELDLSPATIRNEMADLEEMGLLEQPHTSAGRIPSHLGYRFYVDTLMKQYQLSMREMEAMKEAMRVKFNELDRIISYAAGCVSQFTGYTSVAVSTAVNKSVIKKVEIVPVDEHNFLLVIVTSEGATKNRMFRVEKGMKPDNLSMLRHFLNLTITDKPANAISMESILSLETAMGENKDVVMPILRFAADAINEMDTDNIHLAGVRKMLQYPEYQDVDKVRDFLSLMEDKRLLGDLFEDAAPEQETTVLIGDESRVLQTKDASIIVCKYNTGQHSDGFIGIIGPTRMDYAKAITSLEYFVKNLNRQLGAPAQEDKEEQDGG